MQGEDLVAKMDGHLAVAADAESKRIACRGINDYRQADVYDAMCREHTVLAFQIDTKLRSSKSLDS